MTSQYLLIGLSLMGCMVFLLKKWGIWRAMIALSIVSSSLRAPLFQEVPSTFWYILQFGSLGIAFLALLLSPARALRRIDRNVITCLVIFLFFAAMSVLVSAHRRESLVQVILLAGVFGFLIFSYKYRWDTRDQIRGDLSTIFLTIVFLQAVGLMGYAFSSWAIDPDYGRFTGVYSNANYAGMMAAIAIPLGLGLMKKEPTFRSLLLLTTLYLALLLSGSRGSILAASIGIVLVLSLAKGRALLAFLPVVLPSTILFFTSGADFILEGLQSILERSNSGDLSSGRLDLYGDTFGLFLSAPILGVGYRASELVMGGVTGHNVYLVALADVGILGFGAIIFLIAFIIKAAKGSGENKFLFGVFLTVGVIELTESSIFGFGGPTALTVWLIALMLAASGCGETNPLSSSELESQMFEVKHNSGRKSERPQMIRKSSGQPKPFLKGNTV
ncbi:O-antigen ligase family protein [Corynebacterium glutamicum]|uniref:O-antigen ligase family protein n=1 Tax=Corynebacterium glutamicum TaxID=1718 RepID=UPI00155E2B81|nr:O-antigen ligase family protein [Corynebacterium glutamicum]